MMVASFSLKFKVALLLIISVAPSHVPIKAKESDGQSYDHLQVEEIEPMTINNNKPPAGVVKSFKTGFSSNIVDCVEIHKQIAFEHPRLKNHKILMKPDNIEKMTSSASSTLSTSESSEVSLLEIPCPVGTVPIARIPRKKSGNYPKLILPSRVSRPTNTSNSSDDNDTDIIHQALALTDTRNIAVLGNINVWQPQITYNQMSSATIFASTGDGNSYNTVQAGWMVDTTELPHTYLYTYWLGGNNTGCKNLICPGFIQVSSYLHVGTTLLKLISVYDGPQYHLVTKIAQDGLKNWWLYIKNTPIGYWPREIFNNFDNGATTAGWGGYIYTPSGYKTPPMGSGHLQEERFKKACYISQLRIATPDIIDLNKDLLHYYVDKPECYDLGHYQHKHPQWASTIFFGGPPDCVV